LAGSPILRPARDPPERHGVAIKRDAEGANVRRRCPAGPPRARPTLRSECPRGWGSQEGKRSCDPPLSGGDSPLKAGPKKRQEPAWVKRSNLPILASGMGHNPMPNPVQLISTGACFYAYVPPYGSIDRHSIQHGQLPLNMKFCESDYENGPQRFQSPLARSTLVLILRV